jgi:hypothetical protein
MASIERVLAQAGLAWCCCVSAARAEAPAPDAAPSREQCLALHEQAQDARIAGQLLAARADLRECSAATCPALVTRDCVSWLSEVEQQIPSVIFRAVKHGDDLAALRVREGERLLTETLTGTPLELDPGPHHFVAELPGFPAQDATYVLQAGDKARVVLFEFVTAHAPTRPNAPGQAPPLPPAAPLLRPIPQATYVLGGVTLAAAVTSGVLGGLALSKRHDAESDCAPLCTDRDISGVKGLALGSDVATAIALVAAGAAIYTYVARPSVAATNGGMTSGASALPTPHWHLAWTGLGVSARGSF